MLAGLPKAPSAYNPVANPQARAASASTTCCGACTSSASSPTPQFTQAQDAPLVVRQTLNDNTAHAEFVAEMVRQAIVEPYGDDGYTRGFTRLHHDPQGRPGRRLRRGAPRRARLRPPPRLPRARKASSSLPATRRARGRTRRRASQDHDRQRRPARRDRARRQRRREVKARAQRRRHGHDHRRRPASSPRARSATRPPPPTSASAAAPSSASMQRRQGRWQIVQLPEVEAAFVSLRPAATARSARWSAASTSTATSSTTSRRPGASPARASSRSSIRPRWKRASAPATVVNDAPVVLRGRARPAASAGSRRTTTASSRGRCACARR